MTDRYWYHLTDDASWADTVILSPRVPKRGTWLGEPQVSRICVCPSIVQCFIAACWYEGQRRIYKTEAKLSATPCYGVADSGTTQEHWILEPTRFKLAVELSWNDLKLFPRPPLIDEQERAMEWLKWFLKQMVLLKNSQMKYGFSR